MRSGSGATAETIHFCGWSFATIYDETRFKHGFITTNHSRESLAVGLDLGEYYCQGFGRYEGTEAFPIY